MADVEPRGREFMIMQRKVILPSGRKVGAGMYNLDLTPARELEVGRTYRAKHNGNYSEVLYGRDGFMHPVYPEEWK